MNLRQFESGSIELKGTDKGLYSATIKNKNGETSIRKAKTCQTTSTPTKTKLVEYENSNVFQWA